MTVFWDVAPCSLVEIDRCFRDAYCFYHQGDEPEMSPNVTPLIEFHSALIFMASDDIFTSSAACVLGNPTTHHLVLYCTHTFILFTAVIGSAVII
jgi:hypothetical protein